MGRPSTSHQTLDGAAEGAADKRRSRVKGAALVAAGLVVGSILGGVAYASIPSSSGVIHACYSTTSNPTGRLRVIDTGAGQSCGAGEVGLNWNQSAFNFQGAWSNSTAYAVGDVVTNGGSSYLALAANTNVKPKTDPATWAVLAAKGAAGVQGVQGPPGPDNLHLTATNGTISVTLAAQKCAILNVSASGITPGDTGLLVPDAASWSAGITLTPLRATANNLLPVDFCNPTAASVSATNVQVTTYRIDG